MLIMHAQVLSSIRICQRNPSDLLIIILLMITTMKICDVDYDHFDDDRGEDDDAHDYHDDIHWSLEDRT